MRHLTGLATSFLATIAVVLIAFGVLINERSAYASDRQVPCSNCTTCNFYDPFEGGCVDNDMFPIYYYYCNCYDDESNRCSCEESKSDASACLCVVPNGD